MSIGCRKSGFPVNCPRCGHRSGHPNGTRQTPTQGPRQQARCYDCKYQWSLFGGDASAASIFGTQRIHVSIERLLKAVALVVVGVPMNTIERVLRIKSETIKRRVLLLIPQWERLSLVLQERFEIPDSYCSDFYDAVVVGVEFEPSAFRCWSKEFSRLNWRDAARDRRVITRIVGRQQAALILAGRRRSIGRFRSADFAVPELGLEPSLSKLRLRGQAEF
jgi:transposase-like protein